MGKAMTALETQSSKDLFKSANEGGRAGFKEQKGQGADGSRAREHYEQPDGHQQAAGRDCGKKQANREQPGGDQQDRGGGEGGAQDDGWSHRPVQEVDNQVWKKGVY